MTRINQMIDAMDAHSIETWQLNSKISTRQQIDDELVEGFEIEGLEGIEFVAGELLSYQGRRATLYIKDTNQSKYTNEYEPENSKKFHLAYYKTLKQMKNAGRYERYVVTTNNSGDFRVFWKDRQTSESGETTARLKPCQYCLDQLSWDGFNYRLPRSIKREIVNNFSLVDFDFTTAPWFPLPKDNSNSMNSQTYSRNWQKLSKKIRERHNWICSSCKVNLNSNQHLLHVHHKNGVKGDNSDGNLTPLCVVCHAEQPFHSHMLVNQADKNKILRLRKGQ